MTETEKEKHTEKFIIKLILERDEARRLYCSVVENSRPHGTSAEDVAKSMGWECFRKNKPQKEAQ